MMDWMFSCCKSLITLDISNFNTSQVTEMDGIFCSCELLNYLNLSKFDTSKVKYMYKMFINCKSLKSLDLSNFNTENATLMYYMFYNCYSLSSLNLSGFNTIKVENMSYMFYGCSKLISLDISNFKTLNVEDMDYMFYNCNLLNYLNINISNFDTSKVIRMSRMFYNCLSLNSLDVTHFNTSQVKTMDFMFYGCSSLNSLDLTNFNTSKVEYMRSVFKKFESLKELNITNFDTSKVRYIDNLFACCSNLTSLNLSNFNFGKVVNMEKMFYNCTSLEYINLKNAKIKNSSKTDYIFSLTNNNITICTDNVEWSNLLSNENLIINCFNKKDNEESFKCYKKVTNKINNNICQSCGLNYITKINNSLNYINCYKDCPYYHFFDIITNEMFCLESKNCSGLYDKLIQEKSECINDCKRDDIYKYELDNQCFKDCPNKTNLVSEITKQLINEINTTEIENGNDKEIEEENIITTLTTTANQKSSENKNKTTIDLGECEYKLKSHYNISLNDFLYIIKLDIKQEGMKIPKIEYEVYYPFNLSNGLTKLNLSVCKDTKVDISIPVVINENIEKYNISSDYYNDICSTTTSKSGTDITLNDRKNEFINDNMTLCEENCKFIEYDYINKKAKCSCEIKISLPLIDEIKFDKDILKNSFIDINNIANFQIMKFYKNILDKKDLKNNY